MAITTNSQSIEGLVTFDTDVRHDNRGSFTRLFCTKELESTLGHRKITQINRSVTHQVGAVRGLHFQNPPHSETKIVRCLRGRVFDVVVDIRMGSPTLLNWFGVELSAEKDNAIVIPEGFAHGFQVLEPDSELLYLHTAFYEPSAEGGLLFNDAAIGINWPVEPQDLSERDLSYALIDKLRFQGVIL